MRKWKSKLLIARNWKSKLLIAMLGIGLFVGSVSADQAAGTRQNWYAKPIGFAAGSAGNVLAAVTDTGAQQVITTGILPLGQHARITATSGGTAASIKAIQVTIGGTDPNGLAITEVLPVFTENTATTVQGNKVFATVNSVTIPAHDATSATTSVETGGAPTVADIDAVMLALTDDGAQAVVTTGTDINAFDVPRNITATSGGTANDIGAVQVIIVGTNIEGASITETLPIFTANSATTVAGAKIFKTVTSITIPAHDGTEATTSVGVGNVLGIGTRLKRNTTRNAYLDNVLEGTAPTVTFSATAIESNGADLDSALDSTPVILEYMETPW